MYFSSHIPNSYITLREEKKIELDSIIFLSQIIINNIIWPHNNKADRPNKIIKLSVFFS